VCLLTLSVTVLINIYITRKDCGCVFTDGTCDCVKVIFILHERTVVVRLLTVCVNVLCTKYITLQDCSCGFIEVTCDCVKVIFI
jgi:hypothetical protein